MKIIKKISVTIASCIMLSSLVSCMNIGYSTNGVYSNPDKYTAGDCEISQNVNSIDINWTSGKVDVYRQEENTVSIVETAARELSESEQVHTWLDNGTLRVQYCESGYNWKGSEPDKHLEIKIPKNVQLSSLTIDGASCGFDAKEITADTISADMASGAVKLNNCSAKKFDVDTASGTVDIIQKGESESIKVDTASGAVNITADQVGEISTDTASGKQIMTVSSAKTVKAGTANGNVTLTAAEMPENVSIDSASGDVMIYVPENSDFTANIDTASGDFNTDIPLTHKGDKYICGSGNNKINIDTASGDVSINKTA